MAYNLKSAYMAYGTLNPALHAVYQEFITACLSAIVYS